jgi:sarcosine oxidase subunit beta
MVNLFIPIKPRRGQVLITEAVPPLVTRCLLSAKYIAAKFNPAIAKKGGVGFAVEQTANGNILIGSTREFAGFDRRTTYEGINNIARQILRVIPRLKELQVIRAFAGLRPYTPDGLPILGSVEGVEGFIMAAGHEGDGITLSPITGEIIAKHITSGTSPFSMDHFKMERFNEQS